MMAEVTCGPRESIGHLLRKYSLDGVLETDVLDVLSTDVFAPQEPLYHPHQPQPQHAAYPTGSGMDRSATLLGTLGLINAAPSPVAVGMQQQQPHRGRSRATSMNGNEDAEELARMYLTPPNSPEQDGEMGHNPFQEAMQHHQASASVTLTAGPATNLSFPCYLPSEGTFNNMDDLPPSLSPPRRLRHLGDDTSEDSASAPSGSDSEAEMDLEAVLSAPADEDSALLRRSRRQSVQCRNRRKRRRHSPPPVATETLVAARRAPAKVQKRRPSPASKASKGGRRKAASTGRQSEFLNTLRALLEGGNPCLEVMEPGKPDFYVADATKLANLWTMQRDGHIKPGEDGNSCHSLLCYYARRGRLICTKQRFGSRVRNVYRFVN